jgi:hypothetical protein
MYLIAHAPDWQDLTEGGRLCPLLWGLYMADLVTTLQRSFLHITLPPPDLALLIAIPPSPPSPSSTVSSRFLILPSRLLPRHHTKTSDQEGTRICSVP